MPRPKKVDVVTVAPEGADGVLEVWRGIDALLALANQARVGMPEARPICHDIERALNQIRSSGRATFDKNFPRRAFLPFVNLVNMLRRGALHVNVCPECDQWFRSYSKARKICQRRACALKASRKRTAAARRRERDLQKKARERA